jgi:hypothetical protein
MSWHACGSSDKEGKMATITSVMFLYAAQVATTKKDPSAILTIDDNINQYRQELQTILDLETEFRSSCKDNSHYTYNIRGH